MPLPDFIIIGAQRCGTSSLIRYLADHPDVVTPNKWEIHFFDFDNWRNGVDWYERQLGPSRPGGVHGEKSPGYMAMPRAAERAAAVVPNTHIIVMLRDPVARAHSHYKLRCHLRREHQPFDEAIDEALKHLDAANWLGYVKRGYYAQQLKHWFQFYPRGQFHIIQSELFYHDPRTVYDGVLQFLCLDPHHIEQFGRFGHVEATGRCPEWSFNNMTDATRNKLREHYRRHNEELERLLDRRFGW
jgi:hypothetical protein